MLAYAFSVFCSLSWQPDLFSEDFFERWKMESRIRSTEPYRGVLNLWHPELLIRAQNSGLESFEFGIEYRPRELPLGLSAGHLSSGGLLELLHNPLSADDLPGQGSFLGLPGATKNFPALQLSLPFLDAYIATSPDLQLDSLGGTLNIGQEHKFLRIITQFQTWQGEEGDELLDLFWMSGMRTALNLAAILDIPTATYEDDPGTGLPGLYESFAVATGLQTPLPVMTLSDEPYMLSPALWWFKINYRVKGSFLSAEESSLHWDLGAQAAYLSGKYMPGRMGRGTVLGPGQFIRLRGRMGLVGIGAIYFSLLDRGVRSSKLILGLEADSTLVDIQLEMDYDLKAESFYSRFFFGLRGLIQPRLRLNLFWHELKPQFANGELGLALDLDAILLEFDLWCKNDRVSELLPDFLPPAFDTLIGLKINTEFEIQLGEQQLRIECAASSSRDFFLDRILYESAPVPPNWELSLLVSIEG